MCCFTVRTPIMQPIDDLYHSSRVLCAVCVSCVRGATAGDFSLSCKEKELVDFTEWLHEQPYAHKIVVAGRLLFYYFFYWQRGCSLAAKPSGVLQVITTCYCTLSSMSGTTGATTRRR